MTEFERRVLTSEKAGKKFMDMFLKKVNLLCYLVILNLAELSLSLFCPRLIL